MTQIKVDVPVNEMKPQPQPKYSQPTNLEEMHNLGELINMLLLINSLLFINQRYLGK